MVVDKELAGNALTYMGELLGKGAMDMTPMTGGKPGGGSEDFAFVSHEVPTVSMFLTAGNANEGYTYGQHHPKVKFDDSVLFEGSAAYALSLIHICGRPVQPPNGSRWPSPPVRDLCPATAVSYTHLLAALSRAVVCEKDFDTICRTAEEYLGDSLHGIKTFKDVYKRQVPLCRHRPQRLRAGGHCPCPQEPRRRCQG